MTSDLDDFTRGRDNVGARLSTLEVAAETETRLRAKLDADVSDLQVEFRSQRRLLQALGAIQSEYTARLTRLEAGQVKLLAGVETIIGLLDRSPGSPDQPDEKHAPVRADLQRGEGILKNAQAFF